MEAKMLLRDPKQFPSEKVLEETLGSYVYGIMRSFLETITGEGYDLDLGWRYYNDGKAWLGKVTYKNKTVFWLSVWDGLFKTSFYFTEKNVEAINALDISQTIKDEFSGAKRAGKLIPMIFDVANETQYDDLLAVLRFKMGLL